MLVPHPVRYPKCPQAKRRMGKRTDRTDRPHGARVPQEQGGKQTGKAVPPGQGGPWGGRGCWCFTSPDGRVVTLAKKNIKERVGESATAVLSPTGCAMVQPVGHAAFTE